MQGVPQHIIQRGNNRQICFNNEHYFSAYANWLFEASIKYGLKIHAWVFITNHVHLLMTAETEKLVPVAMQYLRRYYVRYFNREYRRSGTMWEGRYRSCLVQNEQYVLVRGQYMELNPVRAGMVDEPSKYFWSSYQCNGLGKSSKLHTEHPE